MRMPKEALEELLARIDQLANGSEPEGIIAPLCDECSDIHWVRYEVLEHRRNKGGPDHGMRPCSQCPDMADIYLLWTQNHFSPEHKEHGGCSECRPYMVSWKPPSKPAAS